MPPMLNYFFGIRKRPAITQQSVSWLQSHHPFGNINIPIFKVANLPPDPIPCFLMHIFGFKYWKRICSSGNKMDTQTKSFSHRNGTGPGEHDILLDWLSTVIVLKR